MRHGPTRATAKSNPVPEHVRRLRGQLRTCVCDLKLGGTEFLLCSKIEEQPAEYAYAIHVPQRSVRADIAALFEHTIQDQLAGFREQVARAAKEETDAAKETKKRKRRKAAQGTNRKHRARSNTTS